MIQYTLHNSVNVVLACDHLEMPRALHDAFDTLPFHINDLAVIKPFTNTVSITEVFWRAPPPVICNADKSLALLRSMQLIYLLENAFE